MSTNMARRLVHRLFTFLSGVPVVGLWVKRWKINRNFALERSVLNGKHKSNCRHRSILLFSFYRSGSTFVGELMKKIAREAGLTPVDLDGYFYSLNKGKEWEGKGRVLQKVPYQPTGYYYGMFRSFNRGIPALDKYKVVLVLRDPRDVLVSSYYAIYSHVTPLMENKKALRTRMTGRKKLLEQTVDEFVTSKLKRESNLLDKYREYYTELIGKPNVLFLKYEDMVEDFPAWLDQIIRFLEIDFRPGFIEELKAGADFQVSKEDKFKHKRQVTPGDHKRKLKPETIEFLDNTSLEIRKLFGYGDR